MEKILLIEDDSKLSEAIAELLSMENYNVIIAKNGYVGIETANREMPDLIVCDILMPGINGYDVLAALKQNPHTYPIPFLFLTALSDSGNLRYGMELGADDYLTKPFEEDVLLRSVRTRIDRSKKLKSFFDKKVEGIQMFIASSLPHELRTPLGSILGFSQIIDSMDESEFDMKEIKMMNKIILESSQRLQRLITNYTMYITLMNMLLNQNYKSENITVSIKSILMDEAQRIAADYKRLADLYIDVKDSKVAVKEEYFTKLVIELIDNAFKFSNVGTIVKVKTEVTESLINISITNIGKGLTQQQIDNIGAFIQFDRESVEQQGSGLGLSIIKLICDLHGGTFKVRSIPDKVTNITIELPIELSF